MWWIPSRTPQFIEVWDVDTIQRRDSTICIWDCFYFPALTWIPLFSTQINATSCPPTTPPQNRAHRTVFLPNVSFLPLILQKLQPHVWGDPRFKPTPWGAALLSPIYFKVWVYKEREQSFRERWWQRVDGEMARLKKKETDEVKRGEPAGVFVWMWMSACVHLPPCCRPNPREDWLPSKDNLSQTL